MLLNQQLQKLDLGGGITKKEEWEEVGKVKNKERVQGRKMGDEGMGSAPLGTSELQQGKTCSRTDFYNTSDRVSLRRYLLSKLVRGVQKYGVSVNVSKGTGF